MISRHESAEKWLERHEKSLLLGLLLIALLSRIFYWISTRGNPFENELFLDAAFYDRWAVRIAGGEAAAQGPFFMGPLYPYFLAMVYSFIDHSHAAVRLMQHVFGVLTCFLVFFVARRTAGRLTAFLASLVCAVYGLFLYYESQILICSLQTFLLTFFVLLFFKAVDQRTKRWWFATGLGLGLCVLARGNVLLLAPLAAAAPFFIEPARKKAALSAVSFLMALALLILPVTARNCLIGGDCVLLTANSGFNFFVGNNGKATGAWIELPGVDQEMGDLGRQAAEKRDGETPEIVGGFRFLAGPGPVFHPGPSVERNPIDAEKNRVVLVRLGNSPDA